MKMHFNCHKSSYQAGFSIIFVIFTIIEMSEEILVQALVRWINSMLGAQ